MDFSQIREIYTVVYMYKYKKSSEKQRVPNNLWQIRRYERRIRGNFKMHDKSKGFSSLSIPNTYIDTESTYLYLYLYKYSFGVCARVWLWGLWLRLCCAKGDANVK